MHKHKKCLWVSKVVTGTSFVGLKPTQKNPQIIADYFHSHFYNDFAELLQNVRPFATYLNFSFSLCVQIKPQSRQILFLELLRLLSLSLLCGGSNIRTQYLQGLGSVFCEIKGIIFFSFFFYPPPPFIPLKFGLISIGYDIPVPELPPSHETDNILVVSIFLSVCCWYLVKRQPTVRVQCSPAPQQ